LTIPDLSFVRFPHFTEPKNLSFLSRHVPPSIERAEKIIAISDFTSREIAELFPSARGKLAVTPLGVSDAFFSRVDGEELTRVTTKYHLPGEYILFVGTLEPRKNLLTLLEAYQSFRRKSPRHKNLRLVVAGMKGWLYEKTMNRVRDMPPEEAPILIGYVDDRDLPYLYSGARMAVVPSFYEGFGLPCLEAMACGTPLICSNTSSLTEVVGDAAVKVSPTDAGSMAEAMADIVNDRDHAEELVRRGRNRSRQFTWRRCAEETYRVYESVACRSA
jgi:glycosyltransferase involved in cell wall biosynthesis